MIYTRGYQEFEGSEEPTQPVQAEAFYGWLRWYSNKIVTVTDCEIRQAWEDVRCMECRLIKAGVDLTKDQMHLLQTRKTLQRDPTVLPDHNGLVGNKAWAPKYSEYMQRLERSGSVYRSLMELLSLKNSAINLAWSHVNYTYWENNFQKVLFMESLIISSDVPQS
ncbi:hypothetical protein F2Q70_00040086 [Brassica cretica]|uniref:Uncharacterized protein n=1 Tax=Brassica cretica TaxID=69181 RepID=A0A8S9K9L5_BRACR|nr:hypothetical protein F2Q70_00040086 [Brassica cretica]